MGLPYIKFYPGDYFRDTYHLTHEQHGVYFLLLMHQWSQGSLPDDPRQLAAMCHINDLRLWNRIAPAVLKFFDRVDGRLIQPRMAKDRQDAETTRAKLCLAGAKGVFVKALKTKERAQANGTHRRKPSGVDVNTDSPTGTESEVNYCALDHEFAQIMTLYPRRTHRQEGRMAYHEARKIASFREIVAGIDRLKSALPDDPQFIPSLPKWLLGERWNDEPMAPAPKKRDRTQEVLDKLKESYNDDDLKFSSASVIDLAACRKAE